MWLQLFLACAAPGPLAARAAWLQEQLTADNAYWLTRSPTLVETKYARMAADPYDWMRGTTALFLADQLRPDPDRAPTRFLVEADAASVLLVGDPHIENLGTCLPGEEPDPGGVPADAPLLLEWVDLDAATFGPWTGDTRRAALALALVAEAVDGCEACVGSSVSTFAAAYADEIEVRATGAAGWQAAAEAEADGSLVTTLRQLARTEGAAGAALDADTLVEADTNGIGRRRLALDEHLDADGDGTLALRPRDEAQLARLLDAWSAGRPEGFRVLDAARRWGKGVASLPAVRFLVLWDRGDAGLADDRLLNVREVVDPPSVDGEVAGMGSVYRDNAERIAAVPATVWSRPDADARMAGIADGAAAFKTTTISGWFQTFDHAAVPRAFTLGTATEDDLSALAAVVGRALASAHARGTTLDGEPALAVIAADLSAGGGAGALVEERVRDAVADLDTLRVDHALFQALLDDAGPRLGAEVLYP